MPGEPCSPPHIGTKVAIEMSQMTRKIALLAAVLMMVAACSRSANVQRGQQQYEVVQEGSASGVTSTINAPGDTKAPVLTDTNVDTTTNFTLPTNPAPLGTDTTGTSIAGSLPPVSATPSYPRASAPSRPRTTAPVVTDTVGSTTPPMPRERQSEPPREQTDTTMTTTAAPAETTDTTSTSTTTTTSSDTKKKKDEQPPPPPPPPPTDTTSTRG
jgi:hypothetical protein